MKVTTTFILVLVLYLNANSQSKHDQIEQIMKKYHTFNMFEGSVLVAEQGKLIYKGAFGQANREWNIPNTTDTKFMIGSISKPITAFLMLIQVQKGLISLDKTISDYIPEFNKANGSQITIRQLLSHTSGMPNYDIIPDFFPRISRKNYTREEYIKIYMDSALQFKPGSQFFYSSWGYFTLGYVMERVTGKSYSQLMKEDIFDKLGMSSSGSYFHTQVVLKRATGYDYTFGGFTSGDFRDQSNTMGTGDLYSTVEDLFKLHLAITNHTLLNKELTKEMLKPGIPPIHYGYGWFNRNFKYTETDSVATNFHLGMTDGFIAFMLRIPSTNSMTVILCNASPTDFFGITKDLMKVLYNKPVVLKEPLQKVTERVLASKGAAAAVKEYKTLRKDTAKYYVDWISMNFLVEQLTTLKRYDDARIIGELNAEEFPDRDLVFFTLGKAYEALNMKKEAIAAYEKTLKIFPNYEEAKNRLKELK